jgi:hypothetical protein
MLPLTTTRHPRALTHRGRRREKRASNGTSVTANAFGSDIPLISNGLLSENLSNQNPRNGADFCPVVSSRAVLSSNCCGNSVLHDIQGSDLAKAAISHVVPGSEKVKGPYLSGGWHSTSPVNTGKLNSTNVPSSQKMPFEANSSISKQSSTFMSGCPRVFCLDTSECMLMSVICLVFHNVCYYILISYCLFLFEKLGICFSAIRDFLVLFACAIASTCLSLNFVR